MVVTIFATVMVLTIVWILLTPREYRATATLLFDSRAPNPDSGEAKKATDISAMLATEAQVLQSDILARKVAEKLGLINDPDLKQQWQQQTGGAQSFEGWLQNRVRAGLEVEPSATGNTIAVSYRSPDSEKSALMANSFASAFNDARLSMSNEVGRRYALWFQKRIGESRERLEEAQTALSDFQRKRGIIATGAIDAESTRLSELSGKLSAAEASAADANARAANGASMPEVQSSGVVQGLRSQIAAKSAEIRQMSTELGPNHPLMAAANAQLGQLQAALAAETGKTAGGLSAASSAASANRAAMQNLLDQQRGRMLALAADRGKLQVLESNVESARKEYDSESQKLAEIKAQSTLPSLNVVRLNNAEPPLLPNAPNIAVRFVMMTLLGGLLAVAAAIFAEWMRPRVRSRDAVAYLTGAPLLGSADIRQIRQQLLIEGGTS
ncbi:MAG: exopolysaccharide biosynthesis protein [Sphingobium sp.]